jgi:hypothetical protein
VEQQTGLEAALARTEDDLGAAARTAASVGRELKRARHAAAAGQLRDLRRALDAVVAAAGELAEQAAAVRDGYDVDEMDLLSSGSYRKELLAAAAEAGLSMYEEDERLLCYPSLVRILPNDLALRIDRRRERRLRPSVVVQSLARAQQSGPRFKPGPFLESLLAAYDLVVARQRKQAGAVVRLHDIYGVLTLLPGQARDYSRQEFARDLYLLDQSGETGATDAGGARRLRWAASTGTKQPGVLTTVSRSGQQQRYWGVSFTAERRDD